MPATVVKILVEPGAPVSKGDIVLMLEAMKMELPVRASRDGVVRAVLCKPGELVQPGSQSRGDRRVTSLPRRVTVYEVGPRDGLQNEKADCADRPESGVHRSAFGRRLPSRSKCRRSSRRNGCRKWPMRKRCSRASSRRTASATRRSYPNRAGSRSRVSGGRPRDRDLRGVFGDVQPPQHQSKHRRVVHHVSSGH